MKHRNIVKKQTHWGTGLKRNTAPVWLVYSGFILTPVKRRGECDSKDKAVEEFHILIRAERESRSSLNAAARDHK